MRDGTGPNWTHGLRTNHKPQPASGTGGAWPLTPMNPAGGRREIVAQPKVFGFDTGLVCYARGWDQLRTEDCGVLWEHLVLDTLIAAGLPRIHFWRDKQQREVDFVVPRGREAVEGAVPKVAARPTARGDLFSVS